MLTWQWHVLIPIIIWVNTSCPCGNATCHLLIGCSFIWVELSTPSFACSIRTPPHPHFFRYSDLQLRFPGHHVDVIHPGFRCWLNAHSSTYSPFVDSLNIQFTPPSNFLMLIPSWHWTSMPWPPRSMVSWFFDTLTLPHPDYLKSTSLHYLDFPRFQIPDA